MNTWLIAILAVATSLALLCWDFPQYMARRKPWMRTYQR